MADAKILFIKCSRPVQFAGASILSCAPMGLLYVAACARERCKRKFDIKIIDVEMLRGGQSELDEIYKKYQPDIVGLSAVTGEAGNAAAQARRARLFAPRAKIVIGGPHVSMYPQAIKDRSFDFAVKGEGFASAPELFDAIMSGGDTAAVKGLVWRNEAGEIVVNEPPEPADLDDLPFPAWDLIDMDAYASLSSMQPFYAPNDRYATIMTSLGCPRDCIFCHNIFGKKMRRKSAQKVLDELSRLKNEFGVKDALITDDFFNVDPRRMELILDGIIKMGSPFRISFPNGLRGDALGDRMIYKMRDAGIDFVMVSMETASERLQKLLNKNLNVQKTLSALKLMDELGIITGSYFMLGIPTETKFEMYKTIELAGLDCIDYPRFFAAIPQPSTKMRTLAASTGKLKDSDSYDDYIYSSTQINCSAASDEDYAKIFLLANTVTARKLNDGKFAAKLARFGLSLQEQTDLYLPKREVASKGVPYEKPEDAIKNEIAASSNEKNLRKIEAALNRLKTGGGLKNGWTVKGVMRTETELEASFASESGEEFSLKAVCRDDSLPALERSASFNIALSKRPSKFTQNCSRAAALMAKLIAKLDD